MTKARVVKYMHYGLEERWQNYYNLRFKKYNNAWD